MSKQSSSMDNDKWMRERRTYDLDYIRSHYTTHGHPVPQWLQDRVHAAETYLNMPKTLFNRKSENT